VFDQLIKRPCANIRFLLKPNWFFDSNPANDRRRSGRGLERVTKKETTTQKQPIESMQLGARLIAQAMETKRENRG
jgi:hypothetical protein